MKGSIWAMKSIVLLLLSILCLYSAEIEKYEIPDSTKVNAPFTLKYFIKKGGNESVIIPKQSHWYGALELDSTSLYQDDTIAKVFYTLTAFASPSTDIPPFKILVMKSDSSTDTISTDSLSIRTISQFQNSADSIVSAGFLDPMGAGKFPWKRYLYRTLVTIAILLIIGGFIVWVRTQIMKRQNKDFWGNEIPQTPPYEEAKEALKKKIFKELVESGKLKEATFLLSEVLKRYISRRYECKVQESTSSEFRKWIREADLTREQANLLEKFIKDTDPVKFADITPSISKVEELYEDVNSFLDETKPQEEKEEK